MFLYIYCNDYKGIKAFLLWPFSKSLELYLVSKFFRQCKHLLVCTLHGLL